MPKKPPYQPSKAAEHAVDEILMELDARGEVVPPINEDLLPVLCFILERWMQARPESEWPK